MIKAVIKGIELEFHTTDAMFSPTAADRGTLAMLSEIEFYPNDKVLDLGCGYGIVGILAAKLIGADKVVMCDISDEAVEISKHNALINSVGEIEVIQSDALDSIFYKDFTLILSNPPYHTDFSVAKKFIENGFKHLVIGGRMIMVTKRLEWYKNKITNVFGGVRIVENDGYYIFIAEKRSMYKLPKEKNKQQMSKKLQRKKIKSIYK